MTEWFGKRKNKLVFALSANIVVFLYYLLVYYPSFETNDDSGIMALASGLRGVRDAHLIYQNYILGSICKNLYMAKSGFSWYVLVQYVVVFLSLTATAYGLMIILDNPSYLGLIMLVLMVYGYEAYIRIQSTKVVGIAAASGLFLMFLAFSRDRISWGLFLTGFFISWIGSMYRMMQFLCIGAVFTALGFYWLLKLNEIDKKRRTKYILAVICSVFIFLLTIFGTWKYDRMQYSSDSWSYYLRFDKLRSELMDFGIPDFEEHEQEYLSLGLDKTAVKLLSKWTFQDAEKFNADVLQGIADMKKDEHPAINKQFFVSFAKKMAKGLSKELIFLCFCIISLWCLISGGHGWKERAAVLFTALILLSIYGYLYYQGRFLIHRVDVGIWYAATLIMFFLMRPVDHKINAAVITTVFALSLVFTQIHWRGNWRLNSGEIIDKQAVEREILDEIHGDQSHLYLSKIGTLSFKKAYAPLNQYDLGAGDNIYPLGGWMAQTETCRVVLDKYGVSNPFCFRDMIDNEKVYLVDNDIDLTLAYIQRWYEKKARAVKVKKMGRYNIYRIVSR